MLTPHKHLKLNTSVLYLSGLGLAYLRKHRIVRYDQMYHYLERRVGSKDAGDLRVMFGPTVGLLFLLGKLKYHSQNDSFEYLEAREP